MQLFFGLTGAQNIKLNFNDEYDMVLVPEHIANFFDNNFFKSSNLRGINNQSSKACMSIKVVYNNDWVQSAGKGNAKIALQRVFDVLAETQKVYSNMFTQNNQLGVDVIFNIVGGNKAKPNSLQFSSNYSLNQNSNYI